MIVNHMICSSTARLKCRSQVRSEVTGHRSGYRSQVTGQVTGHRSQVTDQVTGHTKNNRALYKK